MEAPATWKVLSVTARGRVVLADEAHGTSFYFSDRLPKGAITLNADMSVVFHAYKAGGVLTQAGILLLASQRVSPESVEKALNLTASSSPSVLLMSSIDAARKQLVLQLDSISL